MHSNIYKSILYFYFIFMFYDIYTNIYNNNNLQLFLNSWYIYIRFKKLLNRKKEKSNSNIINIIISIK